MGVGANSSGNKSLNDRRERAAGRLNEKSAEVEAIREFEGEPATKPVDGAFGKDNVANRQTANPLGEGGGGGGGAASSDLADVGEGSGPA
jgi:hypothetical protein